MTYIDSLLPVIYANINQLRSFVPEKDQRILLSLAKQTSAGNFLTEKQAALLVKILKENSSRVKTVEPKLDQILESALWSKSFREIKNVRKIYTTPEYKDCFVLEFNFNTRLKDKVTQLIPQLRGSIVTQGSKYIITLQEYYLYVVVKAFLKDHFEIEERLLDFYQEIDHIVKTHNKPFSVFELEDARMKSAIQQDIGGIDEQNILLLQDRKCRYLYDIDQPAPGQTLAAKIANRPGRKVFVSSQHTSFDELVNALTELKRLPALLVFDGHSSKKDADHVNLLHSAVEKTGIATNIGIYFRYDKKEDTAQFNQTVASLSYNKDLSKDTVIAGIANNKLPKFVIKMNWKPQTVISFTNGFKNNKSSTYFSDVDLIVYYGAVPPLDADVFAVF